MGTDSVFDNFVDNEVFILCARLSASSYREGVMKVFFSHVQYIVLESLLQY